MTRPSDRLIGLAILLGAVAFGVAAARLPLPFFSDPMGPRTFPLIVAVVMGLCGLTMVLRPDPDPGWPRGGTLLQLAVAAAVLVGYAYALRPLGFLIPTAVAAAILSWQIEPRPLRALLAGLGLSVGLFVLFRFVLGLGLLAFPREWTDARAPTVAPAAGVEAPDTTDTTLGTGD